MKKKNFVLRTDLEKEEEKKDNSEKECTDYIIDKEERIFWLEGEINDETMILIRYIINWNREDEGINPKERRPIRIMFDSNGGSLSVCYSIYDAILASKTPVYGVAVGFTASAAAVIFLATHKRFLFPHSYLLFHQGSASLGGGYSEVVLAMENYREQVNDISKIILTRTNLSKKQVNKKIQDDWYITGQKAIKQGFADEIITNLDEIL